DEYTQGKGVAFGKCHDCGIPSSPRKKNHHVGGSFFSLTSEGNRTGVSERRPRTKSAERQGASESRRWRDEYTQGKGVAFGKCHDCGIPSSPRKKNHHVGGSFFSLTSEGNRTGI
ncbi:hypothetical protein HY620_00305, partial [Candidatus Uhrbacteria bacterium]|nr:hypothetical protein [Candidatus Uhrbacteria bacterium]